nr:uncharacterized protein LOC117836851 isoform X1 [Setaria viridis]
MSDPFYPYSRGALPGGDGALPPPRYSDLEVDLIAARYTGTPPPYPSSADVSAFDSHVGAFDSGVGAFDSARRRFRLWRGRLRLARWRFRLAHWRLRLARWCFQFALRCEAIRGRSQMLKILILSDQGNLIVLCKFNHPKEKVNALEAGTDKEVIFCTKCLQT